MRTIQITIVGLAWAVALSNWWVPGFRNYWLLGEVNELPKITTTAPTVEGSN
jgi:hypothetical protein